ncbi:ZIP family zinc transporter [Exophiala viscosa]|uniref:ZIP family zinc transporter n=1 Tax=Exophiala viscosa TaxID=2486360 RepID=UPI00219FC66C|nr:ZIP family zinc transporter [Exophiala viscosa]
MAIDNDTRGWIMTCISGVACCLGACIICVDIVVRLIPRWHDFSIAESDQFLSASLSMTFGVMLFSSLYSMLPQSKIYLTNAGYSGRDASYILIGLFLAGVFGIQFLSSVIHRFMPSHVVDCDHTHDDEETMTKGREEMAEHQHDDEHAERVPISKCRTHDHDEDTPLLSRTTSLSPRKPQHSRQDSSSDSHNQSLSLPPNNRRPSLMPKTLTRTLSKYVAGRKDNCDETGPCMGFSDPCGQDCFKVFHRRTGHGSFTHAPASRNVANIVSDTHIAPLEEQDEIPASNGSAQPQGSTQDRKPLLLRARSSTHHFHHAEHDHPEAGHGLRRGSHQSHSVGQGPEHHHHVPTNAFMSIGLQTSIAIALHKAPEGFITYATNHANPQLGFAVFMALFIHNITEGFAMSLPLYLALDSRLKAIVWSSVLGGLSQPLGAGIAALFFKLAKRGSVAAPTEGVYGGMFAVTSGVMTSVALSLFAESLQLTHNRGTCVAFAFLGMGILGFSFALTAS